MSVEVVVGPFLGILDILEEEELVRFFVILYAAAIVKAITYYDNDIGENFSGIWRW